MGFDLKNYSKDLVENNVQYITVNEKTEILSSCNSLMNLTINKKLTHLHPFFYTLEDLLILNKKETYIFNCIHFTSETGEVYICDVKLNTYKDKDALISIQNFTSHYNTYQETSQERNVSVINEEKLVLQNLLLKAQEEFKNKFIASFSHELREPLLGIIAFSEILHKSELDYQQKSYLDIISNSGEHLKKLIEDILDLSTLKNHKIVLEKNPFNLDFLISNLAAIYSEKASKKGLRFTHKIVGNASSLIKSDQVRLRQILTNLLNNAINYTEKGEIDFTVFYNQKRAGKINITFSIKDTGIGIAKNQLNLIYDSFTKLNTIDNQPEQKNYGLGLAITKELVATFKGQIEVNSELNKGTEFILNLNLPFVLSDKNIKPEKEIKLNTTETKVLLLDDSEIVQLTLFKMMYKFKNYTLDIETNPNEIVDRLEISDYDLILLDIDLKTHNGLDVVSLIRKSRDKDVKQIPIIAVTAHVMPEELKLYKKAKIKTVLKKPFTEQELIIALNNEA